MQVSEELGDKLKSTFGGSGLVVMKLLLLSAPAAFRVRATKGFIGLGLDLGFGAWGSLAVSVPRDAYQCKAGVSW